MQYKNYLVNKIGFIEVTNNLGLKVIFTAAGAAIRDIYFNNEKMTNNASSDNDFLNKNNIYGKISGPFFDEKITINGKEYKFDKGYSLNNLLYSSKPQFQGNSFLVQYSFKKRKMTDGLPGNITYYITYALIDGRNDLLIDYRATSSEKTPLSMSNNLFFVLDTGKVFHHKDNVIENSKYRVEIESDHPSIKYEEVEGFEGLSVYPIEDIKEENLSYSYRRQVIYKFSKK